jgi:hypothetical protein
MHKFPAALASLYLAAVVASFILMLMTADDTPMSGIFLILVSLPWSLVLSRVQEIFHVNSVGFNGLFLLTGGLLNGFLLYKFLSFLSSRLQR